MNAERGRPSPGGWLGRFGIVLAAVLAALVVRDGWQALREDAEAGRRAAALTEMLRADLAELDAALRLSRDNEEAARIVRAAVTGEADLVNAPGSLLVSMARAGTVPRPVLAATTPGVGALAPELIPPLAAYAARSETTRALAPEREAREWERALGGRLPLEARLAALEGRIPASSREEAAGALESLRDEPAAAGLLDALIAGHARHRAGLEALRGEAAAMLAPLPAGE